MSVPNEQDRLKQAAADWSAEQLRDGMIVGLGSGSTSVMAVDAIGRRVRDGLRIIGIPTSEKTAEQAQGAWNTARNSRRLSTNRCCHRRRG